MNTRLTMLQEMAYLAEHHIQPMESRKEDTNLLNQEALLRK